MISILTKQIRIIDIVRFNPRHAMTIVASIFLSRCNSGVTDITKTQLKRFAREFVIPQLIASPIFGVK